MTTDRANLLAREALIRIIVERMRKGVRRRCDKGLSPNSVWREINRHRV
jgi:hypothetical protein